MRMAAKFIRLASVAAVAYWLAGTTTGDTSQVAVVQAQASRALVAGGPRQVRDMGATYYTLERRASRVTLRYTDGSAVAERSMTGDVKARTLDRAGNEVATLRVQHGATTGSSSFEFRSAAGERAEAVLPSGLEPTLDWAALQSHALSADAGAGRASDWQGRFLRAKGAAARDVDDDPLEIRAEFSDNVMVRTERRFRTAAAAAKSPHAYYVTTISANDLPVGSMEWYPSGQTLAWNFPGLTAGYVDAPRLERHRGWTFVPSMAWANVQGLAFYEFHQKLKTTGPIASAEPRGLFQRIGDAVVPSLHADEGCDYLHWLDGSIFRPCCDEHDRCYAKNGCNAVSWFNWSTWNWACESCNLTVAFCFATGGVFGSGGDQGPGWSTCKYASESCSFTGDECCDGSACSEGFCPGG